MSQLSDEVKFKVVSMRHHISVRWTIEHGHYLEWTVNDKRVRKLISAAKYYAILDTLADSELQEAA